jgi:hypothetical protein
MTSHHPQNQTILSNLIKSNYTTSKTIKLYQTQIMQIHITSSTKTIPSNLIKPHYTVFKITSSLINLSNLIKPHHISSKSHRLQHKQGLFVTLTSRTSQWARLALCRPRTRPATRHLRRSDRQSDRWNKE